MDLQDALRIGLSRVTPLRYTLLNCDLWKMLREYARMEVVFTPKIEKSIGTQQGVRNALLFPEL